MLVFRRTEDVTHTYPYYSTQKHVVVHRRTQSSSTHCFHRRSWIEHCSVLVRTEFPDTTSDVATKCYKLVSFHM